MKNLKTFESFFNYFLYSVVDNTKEIWGYTREDIEDLFIEFNDTYNLPISISFAIKRGNIIDYSISDKSIEELKDKNITPIILIGIFTNTEWCNKFCGEDVDFTVNFINGEYHEDLGKKMYDGFSKISDEIEKMIPKIKKRLPNYKFETCRYLDIDNTYDVHPSGVEYGMLFFDIILEKLT